MRHGAQGRAALPWLAPGTDRDAQRELSPSRCVVSSGVARGFQTTHARRVIQPIGPTNQEGIEPNELAASFEMRPRSSSPFAPHPWTPSGMLGRNCS